MENELARVVNAIPGFAWSATPDGSGHIDFLRQSVERHIQGASPSWEPAATLRRCQIITERI